MKREFLLIVFLMCLCLVGCRNDGKKNSIISEKKASSIGSESATPTQTVLKHQRLQLEPPAVPTLVQDNELHFPRVIGLYQGKNVYDIAVFSSRFFEGIRPKPGRINSDVYGIEKTEDDSYLRVALVIQSDNSGAGERENDDGKISAVFEIIRSSGWPIVEEVDYGKYLPVPCGKNGRYITVLLTRQQLENLSAPDQSLCYFVCWEGYLRGAIEGLDDGQFITD